MTRKILLVALVAISAATAGAAERRAPSMEVLGLTLGAPLSLSECPITAIGTFQMYDDAAAYSSSSACFKRSTPGAELPDFENGRVRLNVGPVPPGFNTVDAFANMVDGNLESLWLYTDGLKHQENVLQALIEKYGEPTELETEQWQNRMGATFDGISATWQFSDLRVSMTGIGSQIDTGYVDIATPTGIAAAAEAQAKAKAATPKL